MLRITAVKFAIILAMILALGMLAGVSVATADHGGPVHDIEQGDVGTIRAFCEPHELDRMRRVHSAWDFQEYDAIMRDPESGCVDSSYFGPGFPPLQVTMVAPLGQPFTVRGGHGCMAYWIAEDGQGKRVFTWVASDGCGPEA